MRIVGTRIRSVQTYLAGFESDEKLYVALHITDAHHQKLLDYGFEFPCACTQMKIPRPLKSINRFNAEGRWQVHRDLPKEPRTFEREYHCVDWHGEDHYGTCYQTRYCYPRTLISPPQVELTLDADIVKSPIFQNINSRYDEIKHTVNMFLEIFGECELLTINLVPKSVNVPERRLPWTILPVGKQPWSDGKKQLEDIIERVPQRQRIVISNRHESIWTYQPEFIAKGDQGFWGYVIYAFPDKQLYIFESNNIDNATYVFKGNWEEASMLTKGEILSGKLHEARIFHTKNWNHRLDGMLSTK